MAPWLESAHRHVSLLCHHRVLPPFAFVIHTANSTIILAHCSQKSSQETIRRFARCRLRRRPLAVILGRDASRPTHRRRAGDHRADLGRDARSTTRSMSGSTRQTAPATCGRRPRTARCVRRSVADRPGIPSRIGVGQRPPDGLIGPVGARPRGTADRVSRAGMRRNRRSGRPLRRRGGHHVTPAEQASHDITTDSTDGRHEDER